jgi:hypothetical protein
MDAPPAVDCAGWVISRSTKVKRAGPSQGTQDESLRDSRDGPGATKSEVSAAHQNSQKVNIHFGGRVGQTPAKQDAGLKPGATLKAEGCATQVDTLNGGPEDAF